MALPRLHWSPLNTSVVGKNQIHQVTESQVNNITWQAGDVNLTCRTGFILGLERWENFHEIVKMPLGGTSTVHLIENAMQTGHLNYHVKTNCTCAYQNFPKSINICFTWEVYMSKSTRLELNNLVQKGKLYHK